MAMAKVSSALNINIWKFMKLLNLKRRNNDSILIFLETVLYYLKHAWVGEELGYALIRSPLLESLYGWRVLCWDPLRSDVAAEHWTRGYPGQVHIVGDLGQDIRYVMRYLTQVKLTYNLWFGSGATKGTLQIVLWFHHLCCMVWIFRNVNNILHCRYPKLCTVLMK